MIERFTRRQLMVCSVLLIAGALHIASLCFFVRYYASSFVLEFGQGFVTLYWGGSEESRNSCVYNAGEWPLRPETNFAGGYLADGQRWEAYGPGIELSPRWLSERIHYRGVLRSFGYSLPQLRHQDEASSALVPVGSTALIAVLGVVFCVVRGWRTNRAPGQTATAP